MIFKVAGVDSLIIYFGDKIDQETSKKVQNAYQILKNSNDDIFIEIVPSYSSILVRFNLLHVTHDEVEKRAKELLTNGQDISICTNNELVEIPVYYGLDVGFDLKFIAKTHNLSVDEVIKIHWQKEYLVYAIGFLPAFAYMGKVDERIATPRLANPRASIPKGSVGIAENQAAIYPQKSPGGWQILGRTPIEMFDLEYEGYSRLKVGNRVRYKPISKDEFIKLGGEI